VLHNREQRRRGALAIEPAHPVGESEIARGINRGQLRGRSAIAPLEPPQTFIDNHSAFHIQLGAGELAPS
ncbi:MAG: hypothetical protein WAM94_00040, partial [Chromatiaceae bacterium]